jgi:hypothetical protein
MRPSRIEESLTPTLNIIVHYEFVETLTVSSTLIFGFNSGGVQDIGVVLKAVGIW